MSVAPWMLSALGGVLAWLGFAGVGIWPLALLAFVPLFEALEWDAHASGRRVLLLGWLFGTVGWMGSCFWVLGTLRTFSGLPHIACWGIGLLFWMYHGGLFAGFGWLWWRARRRGASAALAGGLAIAVSELVYPQMFPGSYAASFHGVPIVLQIGELGGPLLISGLCLAINGAIYDLCTCPRSRRARVAALAVGVSVVATLVYGAVRIAQVSASLQGKPRLQVGIVQPNVGTYGDWSELREGQRRLVEATRQLEETSHPGLIVWPENAYVVGLPADLTQVRERTTGGAHTPIVFGSVVRVAREGERRERNRVLLVDEHGQVQSTYDKVNPLAFGETLPLEAAFPWLRALSPNSGRVEPGQHVEPLRFRQWRISALVCYEDVLPRFVRRVMREGAPHLLVNLTNDVWFGDTAEPWIHLALAKLRAVEQRRFLVRATNTGVSAVIDPLGRSVAQSGAFSRENIAADVAMLEGTTVYQEWGDWPGWLSMVMIAWMAFRRREVRATA